MTLAELQASFWRTLQGGPCETALFVGTPALSVEERARIYADMFLVRQVEALAEEFPKLAAWRGHEAFVSLVRDYVRAHPSEDPDLGKLGRKLSSFCAGAERDLAALEWARSEVFGEADDRPLGLEEFAAALDPESFATRRIELVSALRLLTMEHDVLGLWDALEAGRAPLSPRARRRHAVVWRKGTEIFHAGIDAAEAKALALVRSGALLGDVCGAFDSPERAFAAFQEWLAEGFLRREGGTDRPRGPRCAAPE